jgi:plastocyanin
VPRISLIRIVAAALLVAIAGCGTAGSKIPVSEITAKTDAGGVQRVVVEVHSFYFKPSRILVKSGTPVELTLKFKNLFTPHNLTCGHADAGIEIDKSAGFMSFHRTKSVRFTPTTPGEYSFYCGVGSHMSKGMTGTIVVQ